MGTKQQVCYPKFRLTALCTGKNMDSTWLIICTERYPFLGYYCVVYLDNVEFARLWPGEEKKLPISPSAHTVFLKYTWRGLKTNCLKLEVRPGSTVYLKTGYNRLALLPLLLILSIPILHYNDARYLLLIPVVILSGMFPGCVHYLCLKREPPRRS